MNVERPAKFLRFSFLKYLYVVKESSAVRQNQILKINFCKLILELLKLLAIIVEVLFSRVQEKKMGPFFLLWQPYTLLKI